MRIKVSQLIINKILEDNNFSLKLAQRIGVQQQSIKALAKRNSKILTLYEAVLFYKENGFQEDEIFLD